jgi:hypothetical protein
MGFAGGGYGGIGYADLIMGFGCGIVYTELIMCLVAAVMAALVTRN